MRALLMIGLLAAVLSACERDAPAPDPLAQPGAEAIAENNRGVALMGYFDYPGAHDVFAALVERYPDWTDAQLNLAVATLNRQRDGDEQRAMAIVADVLEREPAQVRAHYLSGLLKLYIGETDAAVSHFRRVVAAQPEDAYAAYYLGQALSQSGQPAEALEQYRRAMQLDPYLRSAYYRAAMLLRDGGTADEAASLLSDHSRLESNPRARVAEFKYTRMGPLAEAIAVGQGSSPVSPAPARKAFADQINVAKLAIADAAATLTTVDIDADGDQDLFATRIGAAMSNQVLVQTAPDRFEPVTHPLNATTSVNAVAWGDYDNDGLVDVYLCRHGANQLWRQVQHSVWEDVTDTTGTANGDAVCADTLMIDADHDGDLDLLIANSDAPNELFSNNRDGSFRPLAGDYGLAGRAGSRQLVATDIDNDRDLDLIVIKQQPPHEVFVNDRIWQYRLASETPAWAKRPVDGAVAVDLNADGRTELVTLDNGRVTLWFRDKGTWQPDQRVPAAQARQLLITDFDGNGLPDLLTASPGKWSVSLYALAPTAPQTDPDGSPASVDAQSATDHPGPSAEHHTVVDFAAESPLRDALPLYVGAGRGPALVTLEADGSVHLYPPAPERYRFVALQPTGKEASSESMRSNRDGIGARIALRVGSHWSIVDRIDNSSAAGQSLQPVMLGLLGAERADFVALTWSDGVFQTELDLGSETLHRIEETQRQLSSCPVLFAWDGERYAFVTDLLGVGGLGFFVEPGVAATPRPWEYLLIPDGALASRDGEFILKLTEPMEEVAYLDSSQLHVYDLPPDVDLVVDDRMVIAGPAATGAPLFYRDELIPLQAFNDRGDDVTREIRARDYKAAPVGPLDTRFTGRLAQAHELTLDFEKPLDLSGRVPVLVIDGWVEYPYSQTVFAAWQADAAYEAPSLQAYGADGRWQTVYRQFGYPAGMPRRMALPLRDLPAGTMRLRLSTNLEIYYDRISVVFEAPYEAAPITLRPLQARQRAIGFPRRSTGAQRLPSYDYQVRDTFWDTRYPRGAYSAFGPVTELVAETDDAVAVIGPGEEVELRFPAQLPDLPAGWHRRYVLEVRGWAKDMDMYTYDGGTVGPMPQRVPGPGQARDRLHQQYHTRFQSGY